MHKARVAREVDREGVFLVVSRTLVVEKPFGPNPHRLAAKASTSGGKASTSACWISEFSQATRPEMLPGRPRREQAQGECRVGLFTRRAPSVEPRFGARQRQARPLPSFRRRCEQAVDPAAKPVALPALHAQVELAARADGSRIDAHHTARQVTIEMIQDFEFSNFVCAPAMPIAKCVFEIRRLSPRVSCASSDLRRAAARLIGSKTDRGAAFEGAATPGAPVPMGRRSATTAPLSMPRDSSPPPGCHRQPARTGVPPKGRLAGPDALARSR